MKTKTGFTLNELLGVVAIIAILAAILFPVFAKAIEGEKAKQAQCISNLKKLGQALIRYTEDYDKTFPCNDPYPPKSGGYYASFPSWVGYYMVGLFAPYVNNQEIYDCQSGIPISPLYSDYGFNFYLTETDWSYCDNDEAVSLSAVQEPAKVLLMADLPSSASSAALMFYFGNISFRHNDGANISFVDGHVKWFAKNRFDTAPGYTGEKIANTFYGIKFHPYTYRPGASGPGGG